MSFEILLISAAIVTIVLFSLPLLLFGLPNPGLNRQNKIQDERSAQLKTWAIENGLVTAKVDTDLIWEKLDFYKKNISKPTIAFTSSHKGATIKIFDYVHIQQGSHASTPKHFTGISCQYPNKTFPQFMIVPKNGAYPFRFVLLNARLMPNWAKERFHFSFHVDSRQAFTTLAQELEQLPDAANTSAFIHLFGHEDSICLVQEGEILTNIPHYHWLESTAHEMIDIFSNTSTITDASSEIKKLKANEKK